MNFKLQILVIINSIMFYLCGISLHDTQLQNVVFLSLISGFIAVIGILKYERELLNGHY